MTFIPPFDLTHQYQLIGEEISAAVASVLASGRYINGPLVKQFEQAFAQYIGTFHCVACNSGTDALFLALRAAQIGSGDEVITTPFTFIATAEVISMVGATPVFVDVCADTYNLDLNQIEAAITPKTRAIIPVHLFGKPVDMDRLKAIAQAHNLLLIEDCAQATGAEWNGAKVGSIGDIGCFSFFPTKNLGACGDGGAVTTHDPAIARQIEILREHGQPQRYVHESVGINSRLDAIQAAILLVKLRYLDQWNAQRQAIAQRYQTLLQPVPGVMLPQPISGGTCVWNQYTLRLVQPDSSEPPSDGAIEETSYRDRVRHRLQDKGISSMVYYPIPLHQQPVYANLNYPPGRLPIAEQLAREVLSLPMFPELTEEQQQQIVYALKESLA